MDADLIFPARGADGKQQLATRLLDETSSTLLAGTENAIDPFFSPDGEWVGFFADGKLKKISVHGGVPVSLCASSNPRGASWGDDHKIVAALNIGGGVISGARQWRQTGTTHNIAVRAR